MISCYIPFRICSFSNFFSRVSLLDSASLAAVFQNFLQQYHLSLDQPGSIGRSILPKPPSLSNFSEPLTFSTPQNPTNPPKIRSRTDPLTDISVAKQPLRQEDSGLGDSLVAGALMTSFDDITGIAQQQSDAGKENKQPQTKNEEKTHLEPCAVRPPVTGKVMTDSDSLVSTSTSRNQRKQDSPTTSLVENHVCTSTASVPISLSNTPLPNKGLTDPVPAPSLSPAATCSQQSRCSTSCDQRANDDDSSSRNAGWKDSPSPTGALATAPCITDQVASPVYLEKTKPPTEGCRRSPKQSTQPQGDVGSEGCVSQAPALGFTKATLQSPRKPAHGHSHSFVRVDDFITALAARSREAESFLRDPRLVAKLSSHLSASATATPPVSLLSHLLTRQPLPGATARKPTATSPLTSPFSTPLDPKFLVNQKPIPAAAEMKKLAKESTSSGGSGLHLPSLPPFPKSLSTQIFPQQVPLSSCGSLGFVTPGGLITTPSPRFMTPQTLLPNTSPGFVSLAPRLCLPSFSSLTCGSVPAATPPTCCPATSQDGGPGLLVGNCPPLKRPKLVD